uniref:Cyclin N-terminal domain-containing protein n=1 Tax=Arcella intermedia TaxID=1963864 RepID=A0A6B2LER1_9EUKA
MELKDRVRKIMVDWIIKVHYTLSLSPETLFLSVSLLDQYTSLFPTPRDAYQLTAIAVLLLSCKVEEVQPPLVEDFLQITNHVFTRQQIKAAEYEILAALRFDLVRPSSFEFMLFYLNVSPVPEIVEYSACYVLESTLMESSMYQFTPSLLAGASLFISRIVHRLPPWTPELSRFHAAECEDFQNCVDSILRHLAGLRRSVTMKGLYRKYSIPAYMHVSAFDYDVRGLLDFI